MHNFFFIVLPLCKVKIKPAKIAGPEKTLLSRRRQAGF